MILLASSGSADILPERIPCNIRSHRDILYLALGDPLITNKQGDFYPARDTVILNDGTILSDYFKNRLGVTHYRPLDKSDHPMPPTGWCSWYAYFTNVTEDEILRNVAWIADNLREFGLQYIQLDDGWQIGHRDWTGVNTKFSRGLEDLSERIRGFGLKPGIWIAPHGQSNNDVVDFWPGAFLLDAAGVSVSDTWEGRFLLDPSAEESHVYLIDLFSKLAEIGFEYFKIDGQPIVVQEYRTHRDVMMGPGDPDDLYRKTLSTIKSAIGKERFLLSSWGTTDEGMGLLDGARTGGDTGFSGEWYSVALRATMRYLFLNNIAWRSDPDVMLASSPLPLEQARIWASIQGLTGQLLMLSDRMYDLSPRRVSIIKKVLPALDILPVDLFPQERLKNVWILKVSHLGREYDVVGVFNFTGKKDYGRFLRWEELGEDPVEARHVFDFWDQEYCGAWRGGYYVKVPPHSVKVFRIGRVGDGPQLVSTDRHITQGWVDLHNLYNEPGRIAGESEIIGNNPYTLFFASPPGRTFEISEFRSECKARVVNNGRWSRVVLASLTTGTFAWEALFREIETPHQDLAGPGRVQATALNPEQVKLNWYQNPPVAGFMIRRDGELIGFSPLNEAVVLARDLETHSYTLNTVWFDGLESDQATGVEVSVKEILPDGINLTDMPAEKEYLEGAGDVNKRFFLLRKDNRLEYSNPAGAIRMGGRLFMTGLAVHARSELTYDLKGLFSLFQAEIGLNDDSRLGSVIFEVWCDGKRTYQSDLFKPGSPPLKIEIDCKDVRTLRLVITDGSDGIDQDYANWANAFLWK